MSNSRKPLFRATNSPKVNKILLVLNIVIFFTALVILVLDVDAKEYIMATSMFFVMLLTGANIYGCWKRLQAK